MSSQSSSIFKSFTGISSSGAGLRVREITSNCLSATIHNISRRPNHVKFGHNNSRLPAVMNMRRVRPSISPPVMTSTCFVIGFKLLVFSAVGTSRLFSSSSYSLTCLLLMSTWHSKRYKPAHHVGFGLQRGDSEQSPVGGLASASVFDDRSTVYHRD